MLLDRFIKHNNLLRSFAGLLSEGVRELLTPGLGGIRNQPGDPHRIALSSTLRAAPASLLPFYQQHNNVSGVGVVGSKGSYSPSFGRREDEQYFLCKVATFDRGMFAFPAGFIS